MPVTAVIFDLDNTLVPEMANYQRAFDDAIAPLLASLGVSVEGLRRAVFAASGELWLGLPEAGIFARLGIGSPTSLVTDLPGARFDAMRDRLSAYRRESWRRGLRACGLSDRDDRIDGGQGRRVDEVGVDGDPQHAAKVLRHGGQTGLPGRRLEVVCLVDDQPVRPARPRPRRFSPPFPDAAAAVRDAASRYRLVLATNGPGDVQRRKVEAAGLAPFFPAVIASGDIGHGKPDPRIFAHALAAIGANAADAVSVGDSIEKDVAGARSAGLRSVLVDRTRTTDGGGAERVIGSLGELGGALASFG